MLYFAVILVNLKTKITAIKNDGKYPILINPGPRINAESTGLVLNKSPRYIIGIQIVGDLVKPWLNTYRVQSLTLSIFLTRQMAILFLLQEFNGFQRLIRFRLGCYFTGWELP